MLNVLETYKRADIYDEEFHDFTVDLAFYGKLTSKILKVIGFSNILEMCCGTGRVTIPLARNKTFQITGVDISPNMLAKAKEKVKKEQVEVKRRIRLLEGDIRDFDAGLQGYDLVLITFNAFLHMMDYESQRKALENAYKHVKSSRYFLAHIFSPDPIRLANDLRKPRLEVREREVKTKDGERLIIVRCSPSYNTATQVITDPRVYEIYSLSGKRQLIEQYYEPLELRIIFPNEWENLLKSVGFTIVEKWGDYDFSPFQADAPQMLWLCEKE